MCHRARGTFQSDIFDKSEPIASREQSLTRICHQNRCGARVWAQGLRYTPLSSSRSGVKCEMGELIDPRTMPFFLSRGSMNSFIHERVMSLPLGGGHFLSVSEHTFS